MMNMCLVGKKRVSVSFDAVKIDADYIKTGYQQRRKSQYSGIGVVFQPVNGTALNAHHAQEQSDN